MGKTLILFFLLKVWTADLAIAQMVSTIWLDDLRIKTMSEVVSSVEPKQSAPGDSVKIGGVNFDRGVIVPATSLLLFVLDSHAKCFKAFVGVADMTGNIGPVKFIVVGDRNILFESPPMKAGDLPQKVDMNLTGIKRLGFLVTGDRLEHNGVRGYWAM